MDSLNGKVALITGVSRRTGIGFAIARRFASMGADLLLHSFSDYDRQMGTVLEKNESKLILQLLEKEKIGVEQLDADFKDPEAPVQLFRKAINRYDHIDILVLNHTYDTLKALDELTPEEIDRHLAVNTRASLLLIQEFSKQHDGRPGGRIILLTSGQHLGPMPHPAYVATKGALHKLTVSLSDYFIGRGITVNTVNPGPTQTYMPDEALNEAVLKRMPLGRWGESDDAARLIAWLVSDDARWITGQVIDSEGGFKRG